MKENTILFIIIGIFLLTFIFNYKEGFSYGDAISNGPKIQEDVPSNGDTNEQSGVSSNGDTNEPSGVSSNEEPNEYLNKKPFNAPLVSSEEINYIKSMISSGKASIQQSIDNRNIKENFDITILDTKKLFKDILDRTTDIANNSNSSDPKIKSLLSSIQTSNQYLNKTNVNVSDLTSALNLLSTIPDVPPFKLPAPTGDECTENKVGCQWNSNPNDLSNWWTEHRENNDPQINRVQWNYHSLDGGDYIKYPWVYRNPSNRTNGTVQFEKYTMDKDRELKDLREKMRSYDISFSSYQSILKNDALLISSINAEKERMKKNMDMSANYIIQTQKNEVENSTCPSLKCIADFGTNIGENLCCGQTGVLQNTEYVCPSAKPTCQNFKCGSKFGTCI